MISKELLSEVLPDVTINENTEIEIFESEFNGTCLRVSNGLKIFTINIHELAHKCKEWAFSNGYELVSGERYDDEVSCSVYKQYNQNTPDYIEKTESEAIFKACQWILENKEEN